MVCAAGTRTVPDTQHFMADLGLGPIARAQKLHLLPNAEAATYYSPKKLESFDVAAQLLHQPVFKASALNNHIIPNRTPWLAVDWLDRWRSAKRGTPQFRPGTSAESFEARIPRRVLMTASLAEEALANYGSRMATFWEKSPDFEFMLFSDADCESYMRAVGTRDEQLAYRLLRFGAPRADLFRAIFMRDLGGIYVDVDTSLESPLRLAIPPWASIVTQISGKALEPGSKAVDPKACWNFNFLAFEPGSEIWHEQTRTVVSGILEQARFACGRDKGGCNGHYLCVQNITGAQIYRLTVAAVARRAGCVDASNCSNATDGHMRRLHVLNRTALPVMHHPCHAKLGGTATRKRPCTRPNESKTHYVGIAEAAWYWHKGVQGKKSGCGSTWAQR